MISLHEQSLPPSDRTEGLEPELQPQLEVSVVREFDHELQADILALVSPDVTQSFIAKKTGASAAAVSNYLAGKPRGDVEALETRLRNFRDSFGKEADRTFIPLPNGITRHVADVLLMLKEEGQFGLITGDAGIGKSSGAELFQKSELTTKIISAAQMHGDDRAMCRDAWAACNYRFGKNREHLRMVDLLVKRAKGAGWLFVVDDAHFLTRSGLKFWWSLFARTACPVCFIGNDDILDNIDSLPAADKFFSRIGTHEPIHFTQSDARVLAGMVLDAHAPEHKAELLAAAVQVCHGPGHGRRLKHQLRLTLRILKKGVSEESATAKELKKQGLSEAQIAFKLAVKSMPRLEEEQ